MIATFVFQLPCLNILDYLYCILIIYIASWSIINIASAAIFLTNSDVCWSYHWVTTCHNVWWWWTGAGCTGVGTCIRGSHARTEEDTWPVHLSILCYIVNCGTAAVAWDAPRRSLPGMDHCHWSVYLRVHQCNAGEVEASGGVYTSGWGARDVLHPRSRNWRKK